MDAFEGDVSAGYRLQQGLVVEVGSLPLSLVGPLEHEFWDACGWCGLPGGTGDDVAGGLVLAAVVGQVVHQRSVQVPDQVGGQGFVVGDGL